MPKLLWVSLVLAIIALITATFTLVYTSVHIYHEDHQPVVTCHWEVPLKANYQVCSNGKVIEQ